MSHSSKRWLAIVVPTFYLILPMALAFAAAGHTEEPYLLPDEEWAKPQPLYVEMYEYVEFYEYVEIADPPLSPEPIIEQTELTPESTVTSTPVEAASEPLLVSEPEVAPEPEPVEAPVEEPAPVEQPAEPEPEPAPTSSGVEQWRGLVEAYFPASEVEYALCIMSHESGGDPGATNGSSGAAGLFQFIPSTWNNMVPDDITGGVHESVYDPTTNVAGAAWLLGAAGWSQWSPHNRGAC